MDAVALLDHARAVGLKVYADGDRLIVRGPRSADAIAQRLLDHKSEVLAALTVAPCGHCGAPPAAAQRLWVDATALRDVWRRTVRELGEAAGWPRVPLPSPRSVAPGELAWRRFMDRAAIYDLQRAAVALREQLGAVADAEPGR